MNQRLRIFIAKIENGTYYYVLGHCMMLNNKNKFKSKYIHMLPLKVTTAPILCFKIY